MQQVVIGVFDTQEQAEQGFIRLRESGYTDDQLALIANGPVGDSDAAAAARAPAGGVVTAPDPAVVLSDDDATLRRTAVAPTLAGAVPTTGDPGLTSTPGSLDDEDTYRPPDGSIGTEPVHTAATAEAADNAVDNAALGTAVGMIAGGGVMGPGGVIVGGLLGALAAGGISALWARYRVGDADRSHYEDMLATGRYLVAVETGDSTGEAVRARVILDEAGAHRVTAQAA
jgi:hypothetical protein